MVNFLPSGRKFSRSRKSFIQEGITMSQKQLSILVLLFAGSFCISPSAAQSPETQGTLYAELMDQANNSEDVAQSRVQVSAFLGSLSQDELFQMGHGPSTEEEKLMVRQIVARELHRRIKGGMSTTFLRTTAQSKSEDAEARILAFAAMSSSIRLISMEEKRAAFNVAKDVAFDKTEENMELRLSALAAANRNISSLKYLEMVDAAQVDSYAVELAGLMQDESEEAHLRGEAIHGLSQIQYKPAAGAIGALLKETENINKAPIARSACVALANLDEKEAIGDIGGVLSTTSNSSIHSSASCALGRLGTEEGLELLVEHATRFDNGACGAAIYQQHALVMDILSQPDSPYLISGIKAAWYLFKDEQIEQYKQKMLTLLQERLSDEVVKEILDQFWHVGTQEEFKQIVKLVTCKELYQKKWEQIYWISIAKPLVLTSEVGEVGEIKSTAVKGQNEDTER